MGTVANSNYGFKGTVSSAETPQVLGNGSLYSVEGKDDLKVTAGGTGDRAVTVAAAPNGAWGDAVLSKWTTGANLNCAANSTGVTRYDTVVIRRTWTPAGSPTGTATLMVLTGGSSIAIAAGRLTDRGITSSDQPIALVPVPSGSAVVGTPIDLRCWTGEGGGLVAEHVAALQYLGSKGTTARIGEYQYTRMEDATGGLFWSRVGAGVYSVASASLPLWSAGTFRVHREPTATGFRMTARGRLTRLPPSGGGSTSFVLGNTWVGIGPMSLPAEMQANVGDADVVFAAQAFPDGLNMSTPVTISLNTVTGAMSIRSLHGSQSWTPGGFLKIDQPPVWYRDVT